MHTKQSLINDLKGIGVLPNDTLLVHSSMKAVGAVEGGAQTILDAFIEYLQEGLLIFPTHTWMEIPTKKDTYDPLTEPSCVGWLTNLFLKQKGVIRSLHPTHSVAAIGEKAKDYIKGEENAHTPCPRSGCWGKLVDANAKILFLGCSLTRNTFIHGVEEWNGVPDRLRDTPKLLKIINPDDGCTLYCTYHGHHCSSCDDISGNYGKLEKPLLHKKIAVQANIGDAHSTLCCARPMAEMVSGFLKINPNLFIDGSDVPENWYIIGM